METWKVAKTSRLSLNFHWPISHCEWTQLNSTMHFRQLDLRTAGAKVHDALLWREGPGERD
jgi:hypothetical protein